MAQIGVLSVGNHFYSLGELRGGVVRLQNRPDGSGIAKMVYFGHISAPESAKLGTFTHATGVIETFTTPSAPEYCQDPPDQSSNVS